MKTYYFIVLLFSFVQDTQCQGVPRLRCPEIVPEHANFFCLCFRPWNMQGKVTLTWPGHSDSSRLDVRNVKRHDNGTRYTCTMKADNGATSSAVYTLRVAYGPSSDNLTISPTQIVTKGMQLVMLTCLATDVYPPPSYTWENITCDNGNHGNACVFTPKPNQNYSAVTCRATSARINVFREEMAMKTVPLTFLHPPTEPPVIHQQYTDDKHQQLVLTCTVAGGQPLVHSVLFFCTDPDLADKADVFSENTVSSSVVVKSVDRMKDSTKCFCNATWGTRPDYHRMSSVMYNIGGRGELMKWKIVSGTAIVVVAVLIVVIAAVVGCRHCAHATRTCHTMEDSESDPYESIPSSTYNQQQHIPTQPLPQHNRWQSPQLPEAGVHIHSAHQRYPDLSTSEENDDSSSDEDSVSLQMPEAGVPIPSAHQRYPDLDTSEDNDDSSSDEVSVSLQIPEAGVPIPSAHQRYPDMDTSEDNDDSSSDEVPVSVNNYEQLLPFVPHVYTSLVLSVTSQMCLNLPPRSTIRNGLLSGEDLYLHPVYGPSDSSRS